MQTIAVPISNPMDVPRLVKFEVTNVVENDDLSPPSIGITLRLYGPGQISYGTEIALTAYDSQASTCLQLNPLQQAYGDLVRVYGQVVSGAYASLSAAYNGNIANPSKRKRCLAVEGLLVGTLLSADFTAI